jgi:TatD DNase family protein
MIDTHAHLGLCDLPISELVHAATQASVSGIINVGLDIESSLEALRVYRDFNTVYPTIGLYPSVAEREYDLAQLERLAATEPFKAIGEIGLDQHHKYATPQDQERLFEGQLSIAHSLGLPVILHNRQTDQEMSRILKKYRSVRRVFHCFSSSLEFADTHLSMCEDTYFSFTGIITYPKSEALHQVIKALPLNRIMIETDCPYLSPTAFRSQKNQPAFVVEVAKVIATIKELSLEDVDRLTTENTVRFFNLK